MKLLSTTVCASALLLTSGIATAGAESGFYLGASAGSSSLDVKSDGVDFSDDATGGKIFGGYNFGVIPLVNLAIEASYVDFGKVSSAQTNNSDVGMTGFDAFGVAGFNLGPVALFGKVGMIAWQSDSDAVQKGLDDSGTDPAYGVGLSFQLGSVQLRAEYEVFDTDAVDIGFTSVGAAWTF